MAVRKTTEESFVVDGPRADWMDRCGAALERANFTNVRANTTLYEISADYKRLTVWGTLTVALLPEGDTATRLNAAATANVDNIFALFGSPGKKIIAAFKAGLG
jgi:hypothetical protein